MAAVLDSHLEGRRFIAGDRITAADCVTAYLIDWANEFQLIDNFAQLRDYRRIMRAPRRRSVSQKLSVKFVPRKVGREPAMSVHVALLIKGKAATRACCS